MSGAAQLDPGRPRHRERPERERKSRRTAHAEVIAAGPQAHEHVKVELADCSAFNGRNVDGGEGGFEPSHSL